jgi:hypothetical protein
VNRLVVLRCFICLLFVYPLLGTTVRFNAQPVLAQGCDYYASPTGDGNGLSESTPFQIADFWSVAEPGDTLCLLDGKYTGSRSMIIPPSSVNGTAGNPITISALNDGMVEMDGEGSYDPVDLSGNDYLIIEGINAHNAGKRAVVHIHNGADHNIIRRVCAWDAPNANSDVFGVHGSEHNLFEDCAGWGVARKIFSNSQGGNYTVYRRCWGRWEYCTSIGPKMVWSLYYNSYHIIQENCIGTWDSQMSTVDQPYGIFTGDRLDEDKNAYSKLLGNIAYIRNNQRYHGEYGLFFITNSPNEIEVKDCISYVEPGASSETSSQTYPFRLQGNPDPPHALQASHITSIGGDGIYSASRFQVENSLSLDTTDDLKANGGSVLMPSMNGYTDGATICYRYVDGVLTEEPLWPWPMNQRIVDAMILSGIEPVDVTATIEQMFGPIPAECKGEDVKEDINLDGRVNILDVQLCVKAIIGQETDPALIQRSDVNGDDVVDQLDVGQIVGVILGE